MNTWFRNLANGMREILSQHMCKQDTDKLVFAYDPTQTGQLSNIVTDLYRKNTKGGWEHVSTAKYECKDNCWIGELVLNTPILKDEEFRTITRGIYREHNQG